MWTGEIYVLVEQQRSNLVVLISHNAARPNSLHYYNADGPLALHQSYSQHT